MRKLVVLEFLSLESGISPKGVIVADYVRAGVKTGSIEQEIPSEAERSREEKLKKEAA